MATHNDIGLSQPAASTITHRLDSVQLDANSTVVLREVLVVGSPETTNALSAVLAGAPASTDWGLVVRPVGYSTIITIAAMPAGSSGVTLNALASGLVSSAMPAAGSSGLLVRPVWSSTGADQPVAISGNSTAVVSAWAAGLQSSAAAAANSSALLVRVVGGVVNSSDFVSNVSSVAGVVTVNPNSTAFVKNAGLSVDSSNYLNVNASFTGSTDVSVSKMPAGLVSSAAPAGNSSALLVRITGGPSSAADCPIAVHGNQSSNSSVYLPVRITNGSAFPNLATDYTHGSTLTASSVTGPASMLRASSTTPPAVSTSDMFVAPWGTLHGAANMALVTSSGVRMDDSTNAAVRVNIVAGSASGPTSTAAPASNDTGLVVRQVGYSTIVTVAAMPANSSIVSVSGFGSLVSSAAPAAGDSALVVRVVGYSTIAQVSSLGGVVATNPNSTAWVKNAGMSVDSSNYLNVNASFTGSTDVSISKFPAGMVSSAAPAAGDSALITRVVGYSTIVSVANTVTIQGNSTVVISGNSTVVISAFAAGLISSAAPAAGDSALITRVVGYSTIVSVAAMPANSSLVQVNAYAAGYVSSVAPAHNSSALVVRQAVSSIQSTVVTVTSSNSTAIYTLLSSVAGRQRVHAYFIGASTSGNHSTILFGSDTVMTRWAVVASSGVWGANLAIAPPGFLFESAAGAALTARIESASTAVAARFALSWVTD